MEKRVRVTNPEPGFLKRPGNPEGLALGPFLVKELKHEVIRK